MILIGGRNEPAADAVAARARRHVLRDAGRGAGDGPHPAHLSEPFRNAYTLTSSPLKDLDYKDPYSEIDIVFLGFHSCIE